MEGKMIKGSLVSVVLGACGFLLWSIIMFDCKNMAGIILRVVPMLLVYIYLSSWCRTVVIEEDAIILKRLRSSVKIDKAEIKEVYITILSTVVLARDGSKHRIVTGGFKRSDIAFLNNRLKDFKNAQ